MSESGGMATRPAGRQPGHTRPSAATEASRANSARIATGAVSGCAPPGGFTDRARLPADPCTERLFGTLPPDLFRLLSGPARWFYADLLEHLDRELFGLGTGAAKQREVVDAIAEFIERGTRCMPDGGDGDDHDGTARAQVASPASACYGRLVATGWLVEHRDRYRRAVDLDGGARLLLDLMLDIKRGRTRSYGGEVLQVLSSLDAARADPADRSEGVRNAARASKSFLGHLRSVSSGLRAAERHVAAQTELAAMFSAFFDDFVARHLVEDYKRLHTQSNPFRFRVQIVERAEATLADPALLDRLAEAYSREGRSGSDADARETVQAELREVLRAFLSLDEHLDAIEDISRDMERRLRNTVRHLERVSAADTGPVADAMQALGRCGTSTVPPGPPGLLTPCVPLGPAHLFQKARRPVPPVRRPLRAPNPDPAFLALQAALLAYRARMNATPDRIRAYLDNALPGPAPASAAELPLKDLDDFIVFERLPLLGWLGDPGLAADFEVSLRPGATFASDWITCPDFTIRRIRPEAWDA